MAKWIIGLVAVLLVGGALWWSGWLKSGVPAPVAQQTATSTAPTPQDQQASIQQQDGMSAQNNASDAAINQDSAAIDSQMQGLNSDQTNVNSSMNDQPVQQSY